MASANKIKLGQVWKLRDGKTVEVKGVMFYDKKGRKKFPVLNLETNRTLNKGPGAFGELVQRAPAGAQSAVTGNGPPPKVPKRAKRKSNRPRCRCGSFKSAPPQFHKKTCSVRRQAGINPSLSHQTPSYDLSEIRHGGYMVPGASSFAGMAQNPTDYPSPLVEHICKTLASMPASLAHNPRAVGRVVGEALGAYSSQLWG